MRKIYYLSLLLILANLVPLVLADWPWENQSDRYTWYFRSDTHTVNGQLGYVLNTSRSITDRNVSLSMAGSQQVWFTVRVYLLDLINISTTLLSNNTINATRTSDGAGIQILTWTPANTDLSGGEAFKVSIFIKVGSGNWTERAVAVSAITMSSGLTNSTWLVRLYTNRTVSGGTTYAYVLWGSSTYDSRISTAELLQINPWDEGDTHLRNRDLISWITTPWARTIGLNFFYGFCVLFVHLTLYLKYEDIRVPIMFFWISSLAGGAGGIMTLLIPALGLHLAWFFLALGLAGTFYSLLV